MTLKPRYAIKCGEKWLQTRKATTLGLKAGWLHYELKDSTIGLARPGTWKKLPPKK